MKLYKNKFMNLVLLFLLFISLFFITPLVSPYATLQAEDIEIEITPPEPLVNESFFVSFKIKSTGNVDPYISFTPSGVSVLGKSEQGVSISTTVINGKFTTTREQSYAYELIADRQGQAILKNVKVEISGKVSTLKDIHINVLGQARKISDAFMEATASKTKVYIGEAIDVNYYLYFKTSISANDVKEFPKLNKFIKRFHHVNSPVETVQYKGQMFRRILAYSAKLFPEKVGNATLDPMTISVQIVENESSSAFGGFGFGGQRIKNKDLSSARIEVEVMPLPVDNVPAGFTGLVGEHEFSLSLSKNKFLVNEPIEVKLEVKGKGAVEKMDAPAIFTDNNLEQFDTKSEVSEIGTTSAKKVFEYTYLGRAPLNIKARELSLAYFDPASGRYIEKRIQIPAIDVQGGGASNTTPGGIDQKINAPPPLPVKNNGEGNDFLSRLFTPSSSALKVDKNPIGLVGPLMYENYRWYDYWVTIFNILLGIAIFLILFFWYFKNQETEFFKNTDVKYKKVVSELRNKGLSYSGLYCLLSALDKEKKMTARGALIAEVLEESSLSKESKEYFKNALYSCEVKSFGPLKDNKPLEYKATHFKELMKYI